MKTAEIKRIAAIIVPALGIVISLVFEGITWLGLLNILLATCFGAALAVFVRSLIDKRGLESATHSPTQQESQPPAPDRESVIPLAAPVHDVEDDRKLKTSPLTHALDGLVQELCEETDELHDACVEIQRQVGEVNAALDQIAAGVHKQAAQYIDIAGLAGQMAEATNNMSTKTESLAASTDQTLSAALTGTMAVSRTVDGMKAIRETVLSSAERIHRLGEQSNRIGEIVLVISEIAEQTNLLALNAAIEAARAGEQGRGFAVVASEVRRLAEKSNRAAKDISHLISDIANQTGEAVGAMKKSTEQVESGVTLAEEAGRALNEIQSAVESSSAEIRFMSQNAADNASRLEELVRSIEDATAITQESSDTLHDLAQQDWFSKTIRSYGEVAEVAKQNASEAQKVLSALIEAMRDCS